MTERVTVIEVSPRDGLQNEPLFVPTADKCKLVDAIAVAGFTDIEVTSFVSARRVPQLADASDVMRGITRHPGVRYGALTPNARGVDAALAAGVDEVAMFVAASETFSQRNISCSIAQSFERVAEVVERAARHAVPVRGYVSCVLACPYEGPIAPAAVHAVTSRLLEYGCYEVSLGDTIGFGTPSATGALLDTLLTTIAPERLAGHFHDTGGRALENVEVSLARGLRRFDAAMAGLGGCPFAPGAAGNVDTVALVNRLTRLGYDTGIDSAALEAAADLARSIKWQARDEG